MHRAVDLNVIDVAKNDCLIQLRPPMTSDSRRPQLLLLRSTVPVLEQALSGRFHVLRPWESDLPRDRFVAANAAGVRAIVTAGRAPVDAPLLAALPALGFIFTTSAGVDHIDLAECARRGIAVTNCSTIYSTDVADYAVGLLLDILRKVSASNRYVRRGLWPAGNYPLGFRLGGKRVGIVGLGNIGSQVAKRLEPFGCLISYSSRKQNPSLTYTYYSKVHELAAENDVLVVTCSLNNETWHIIDKDVMSALGKDGIIVNVGRGHLIDEAELVKRLMQGEIAGAALDVFEHEPAVPEELLLLDNVVLSPHRAVITVERSFEVAQLAIDSLEAFFSSSP